MNTLMKICNVLGLSALKEQGGSSWYITLGIMVAGAVLTVALVITGCKSIPTTETMYKISSACGTATGLIINEAKMTVQAKEVFVKIVQDVRTSVPKTNETFTMAWAPIAKKHVTDLTIAGKIDAGTGLIILQAFGVVTLGIDYVFERYPEAKQYEQLVSAATDGFTYSLLLTQGVTPKSVKSVAVKVDEALIKDCYKGIKQKTAFPDLVLYEIKRTDK